MFAPGNEKHNECRADEIRVDARNKAETYPRQLLTFWGRVQYNVDLLVPLWDDG